MRGLPGLGSGPDLDPGRSWIRAGLRSRPGRTQIQAGFGSAPASDPGRTRIAGFRNCSGPGSMAAHEKMPGRNNDGGIAVTITVTIRKPRRDHGHAHRLIAVTISGASDIEVGALGRL